MFCYYDVGRIETLFRKEGVSIRQFSDRAQVEESTVRRIFRNRSGHPRNIKKLVEALEGERKLDEFIIPLEKRTKAS